MKSASACDGQANSFAESAVLQVPTEEIATSRLYALGSGYPWSATLVIKKECLGPCHGGDSFLYQLPSCKDGASWLGTIGSPSEQQKLGLLIPSGACWQTSHSHLGISVKARRSWTTCEGGL